MYAVIVGEPGVGKSSLVQRVVQELSLPVWGLVTRKGDTLEEKTGGFPVYLQHLRGYGQEGERHLVAYCNRKQLEVRKEAFDDVAPLLSQPVPAGHLVLLDELGVLERVSENFCAAVLELLNRNQVGMIALKHKDAAFLNQVRGHQHCQCFCLSQENREELFLQVLDFMQKELNGKLAERISLF